MLKPLVLMSITMLNLFLLSNTFFVSIGHAQEPVSTDRIRQSIESALPLIEASSAKYLEERSCFGCHHQAMSVLALTKAKQHGFRVNQSNIGAQLTRTLEHLRRGEENYREGKGQGGKADTAGYALWALDVGKQKPNATTSAVTEYLLLKNKDISYWTSSGNRPPSEASDVTTTALAIYGLRAYGNHDQAERIAAKRAKAVQWLLEKEPADHEERVFRLHGLGYLDTDDKATAKNIAQAIQAASQEISDAQRNDGGWSQTDELESDAYATGSALVALHEIGNMSTSSPIYQKAVKYLLDTQHDDGSWHVKSRSKPFQTYFESGFPHKEDQFISMNASCWATYALVLAVGDTPR